MRTQRAFGQNLLLPGAALLILGLFTFLYLGDEPLYRRVLALWSFDWTIHPFLDMEYVTAGMSCWQRGVDVYAVNPCDPLGRLHDYSPLFLRLWFLPTSYGWAQVLGLLQDVLFAASLGFLPAVKGRLAAMIFMLALASPTTLFAMERGNVDVTMFVLIIVGLACLEGSFVWRSFGYAAFLLAGVLKFYPLVVLARALDERPRRFLALAIVSAAVVGGLGVLYFNETRLALSNVPNPMPFGDAFSARQMPNGLAIITGQSWAALPLSLVMVAGAILVAIRLARSKAFADAVDGLSPRAANCLLAGALTFCGCFVVGPSVGYRGILLLLALPGIVLLSRARGVQGPYRLTTIAILLLMWNFVPIKLLDPTSDLGVALGGGPFLAVWLLREILWWIVFTTLSSAIVRFVIGSQIWRSVWKTWLRCETAN